MFVANIVHGDGPKYKELKRASSTNGFREREKNVLRQGRQLVSINFNDSTIEFGQTTDGYKNINCGIWPDESAL